MPCVVAYFAVWVLSGMLHGALLLAFGNPVPALVFTLIFVGLGLAGSGAIFMKKKRGRRITVL